MLRARRVFSLQRTVVKYRIGGLRDDVIHPRIDALARLRRRKRDLAVMFRRRAERQFT